MYNRYIRNDNGSYTRIPEEVPSGGPSSSSPPPDGFHSGSPPHGGPSPEGPGPGGPPPGGPPPGSPDGPPPGGPHPGGPPPNGPGRPHQGSPPGGRPQDGLTSFLRHLLDQLHLDHVDTGDLLLLALLFFLFREDADEELLVALGLLLIL